MKKIALFLALIMILSLLAACGGTEKGSAAGGNTEQDQNNGVTEEDNTTEEGSQNGGQNENVGGDTGEDEGNNTEDNENNENNNNNNNNNNNGGDEKPVDDGKFLEENPEDFNIPFSGYETVTVENEKVKNGNLVLVDADHLYDSGLAETVRVKDYNSNRLAMVSTSKVHLNFVALRKLQEMTSFMNSELQINYLYCIQSGFVTNEEMAGLHANYPNEFPEAAGTSELNTGLAVTVSVYTGAMNYGLRNKAVSNVAAWTDANAHKYGFIVSEDVGENGQLRYVGVAHATYMKENGLSLSEYLTKLQDGNKLQITDEGGLTWTVYRVAASSEGATEIQVPTGMVYDISGDNNGGFIVTVKGVCN